MVYEDDALWLVDDIPASGGSISEGYSMTGDLWFYLTCSSGSAY